MKTTMTIALALMFVSFCTLPGIAQNSNDDAGFEALYKVFPNHTFPKRGRIVVRDMGKLEDVLKRLEGMGEKILGTRAEPLARYYRGNLLFNVGRFEDALKNNQELKEKFPKHGLCRALLPGKKSMVDQAIDEIQGEIDVRKTYKVVKLPHAELDFSGKAVFHTTSGSFEIHCYTQASPKLSANFKKLVEEGYYVGMSFHNLLSFRQMSIGCPNTKDREGSVNNWGQGGPGYDLPIEYNDALHTGGAVSMVATANGQSHGSQFTICLHNQPTLNNKQAVFGKLTRGLEVLRKMSQTRVDRNGRPTTRLEITGTQWMDR